MPSSPKELIRLTDEERQLLQRLENEIEEHLQKHNFDEDPRKLKDVVTLPMRFEHMLDADRSKVHARFYESARLRWMFELRYRTHGWRRAEFVRGDSKWVTARLLFILEA